MRSICRSLLLVLALTSALLFADHAQGQDEPSLGDVAPPDSANRSRKTTSLRKTDSPEAAKTSKNIQSKDVPNKGTQSLRARRARARRARTRSCTSASHVIHRRRTAAAPCCRCEDSRFANRQGIRSRPCFRWKDVPRRSPIPDSRSGRARSAPSRPRSRD